MDINLIWFAFLIFFASIGIVLSLLLSVGIILEYLRKRKYRKESQYIALNRLKDDIQTIINNRKQTIREKAFQLIRLVEMCDTYNLTHSQRIELEKVILNNIITIIDKDKMMIEAI